MAVFGCGTLVCDANKLSYDSSSKRLSASSNTIWNDCSGPHMNLEAYHFEDKL
jgi:hypothetical protein